MEDPTKKAVQKLRESLEEKQVDPFLIGDVVRWMVSDRYLYAAIKTGAGWFTTAQTTNPFVPGRLENYEELLEILGRSEVTDVDVSGSWEEV